MRIIGKVKVNLAKCPKLRDATRPDAPEVIAWAKRSAQKYRSFLQRRFDRFSRSGGYWPKTKRVKEGRGKFILRDTHTLFRALSPVFRNLPGQFERFDGKRVETGYGGPAIHPTAAPLTVAQLASIHNAGTGIIPRRQIIVRPTGELVNAMREDLDKTVKKIGAEVDRG